MNEADIENAFKARLSGGGLTWPIAWPNQNAPGTAPFITVEIVSTGRTDDTLDGVAEIASGFVMAKVVVLEGVSTDEVNRKAQAIADLFPKGLRIAVTVGGAEITITKPSEPLQGFNAERKWHKPVRITFHVS